MARKKKQIEEVESVVEPSEEVVVNTTISTDVEVPLPSEEINISSEGDPSEGDSSEGDPSGQAAIETTEIPSEEVVKPIQRGTEIVINGKTYFQYTDSNGVTYTNPKE